MLLLARDDDFADYLAARFRISSSPVAARHAALGGWTHPHPPVAIVVACRETDTHATLEPVITEARKRWGEHLPVIFLTCTDDPVLAGQFLRTGATTVIFVDYAGRAGECEQDRDPRQDGLVAHSPDEQPPRAGLTPLQHREAPYWHYLVRGFGPNCPAKWDVYFDHYDRQTVTWLRVIQMVIAQFAPGADIQTVSTHIMFGVPNPFEGEGHTGVIHLRAPQHQIEAAYSAEDRRRYREVIERLTPLAPSHTQTGRFPVVPILLEYHPVPGSGFGIRRGDRELWDALREWDALSVPFSSSTSLAVRLYQLFLARWAPTGPLPNQLPVI